MMALIASGISSRLQVHHFAGLVAWGFPLAARTPKYAHAARTPPTHCYRPPPPTPPASSCSSSWSSLLLFLLLLLRLLLLPSLPGLPGRPPTYHTAS